jgi:hypothetical protein
MFSSNFYHAADRLRSAEIVAQLRREALKTPLALDA